MNATCGFGTSGLAWPMLGPGLTMSPLFTTPIETWLPAIFRQMTSSSPPCCNLGSTIWLRRRAKEIVLKWSRDLKAHRSVGCKRSNKSLGSSRRPFETLTSFAPQGTGESQFIPRGSGEKPFASPAPGQVLHCNLGEPWTGWKIWSLGYQRGLRADATGPIGPTNPI